MSHIKFVDFNKTYVVDHQISVRMDQSQDK
jgi:hypothetical protein